MALINCPECGKEVSDQATSCPNCGMPIKSAEPKSEEYLACPKCRSKELHSEQNGFSGGKALAGAIAVGGLGLLAGTIGSKNVNITCLKCGNKFKAGEALIVKAGNADAELESRIVSLLKEGNIIPAADLYQKETHENLANTYGYINTIAAKHSIDLKKVDKGGCATMIAVFIIIASVITYAL